MNVKTPRAKPTDPEIAALAAMLVVRMRTTREGMPENLASPYQFDAYDWLTLIDRCLDKVLAFKHVEAVDDLAALVANGVFHEDEGNMAPPE